MGCPRNTNNKKINGSHKKEKDIVYIKETGRIRKETSTLHRFSKVTKKASIPLIVERHIQPLFD